MSKLRFPAVDEPQVDGSFAPHIRHSPNPKLIPKADIDCPIRRFRMRFRPLCAMRSLILSSDDDRIASVSLAKNEVTFSRERSHYQSRHGR
jgi:hypothetical protein